MTDKKIITTDHPLDAKQQEMLTVFLDTLIPAAEDGSRPGAGEMDLVPWLADKAAELLDSLSTVLNGFDDDFASLSMTDRVSVVKAYSEVQPELFEALLFHTYACYYQDDRVMTGLGLVGGPLFPRGHSIEAGDLSLLDPVMAGSSGYRKV